MDTADSAIVAPGWLGQSAPTLSLVGRVAAMLLRGNSKVALEQIYHENAEAIVLPSDAEPKHRIFVVLGSPPERSRTMPAQKPPPSGGEPLHVPADIRTPQPIRSRRSSTRQWIRWATWLGGPKTWPDVWPIRVAKWGTEFRNWPAA